MAKAPSKRATTETEKEPSLLPLPEGVLKHHGVTIFRAMHQWRQQNRVPPVLLLTGPAGIGKRAVAYFLAQWLLCDDSGFRRASTDEEAAPAFALFGPQPTIVASDREGTSAESDPFPCGRCGSCLRALGNHWVDFSEIAAEGGEGESQVLKIDQFRKLKASIGFGAFDGAFKITLIRDADRMTPQAANSLLKILEEPPPGWIFFLTASDPSVLLPTLVSRCQSLRLRPFSAKLLHELLDSTDLPSDRRAVCAEIAQGSLQKALAFGEDTAWETRQTMLRFVETPAEELGALVEWAAQDATKLGMLLDQLEQALLTLIQLSLPNNAGASISDPGSRKALSAHAARALQRFGSTAAARDFWFTQADRLFRARQQISIPLNRKIVVQDLLLPWLTV